MSALKRFLNIICSFKICCSFVVASTNKRVVSSKERFNLGLLVLNKTSYVSFKYLRPLKKNGFCVRLRECPV